MLIDLCLDYIGISIEQLLKKRKELTYTNVVVNKGKNVINTKRNTESPLCIVQICSIPALGPSWSLLKLIETSQQIRFVVES
tara:strand:+ start:341 stop:586 length:246 start_codon:yes stop_codon:yes gene_type:complete